MLLVTLDRIGYEWPLDGVTRQNKANSNGRLEARGSRGDPRRSAVAGVRSPDHAILLEHVSKIGFERARLSAVPPKPK
jgi:hypothetical protein